MTGPTQGMLVDRILGILLPIGILIAFNEMNRWRVTHRRLSDKVL